MKRLINKEAVSFIYVDKDVSMLINVNVLVLHSVILILST